MDGLGPEFDSASASAIISSELFRVPCLLKKTILYVKCSSKFSSLVGYLQ
jgi:hypothetical protein